MSTVIPPAPPPLPQSAAVSGPVSVTVVSGTVSLPEGALLDAVALARAAKGVVTAQTANGPLELKAGVALPHIPEGARLTLQVQGSGADAQLKLVAVNGRALGGALLPQAGMAPVLPGGVAMAGLLNPSVPQPGGPLQAAAPTVGGLASPDQPVGITATLIRPAAATPQNVAVPLAPGLAAMGLSPDMPVGTRLTVRIAEIGTPVPAEGATPASPNPALPGQPPQLAPQSSLRPTQAQGAPAVPTPQPAAATAPLLPGTVAAQSPGGNALIHTPVGALTLPTHAELPAGTPVILEVVGKPLPPAAPPPPAASTPQGLTAQGWPALTQTLDTLSAAAPQSQAMQDLLRVLPQAGPRLAASMMAFTGALQTGEPRRLLPEPALRGLEKAGKKELAERLKADLESLSEDSGRPVGNNGEWRGYTMPFLNGGAVEPIRLFVRAPGDEGGGGGKRSGGTGNDERFVLDVNLSQLGRFQMDGLVRREDKMFDLIIRTDAALSPEMRRDILGIFANASEVVGTKGTVSFQSGGRWVEFPPAPPPPTRIEA